MPRFKLNDIISDGDGRIGKIVEVIPNYKYVSSPQAIWPGGSYTCGAYLIMYVADGQLVKYYEPIHIIDLLFKQVDNSKEDI
jgi:hypothetical protein